MKTLVTLAALTVGTLALAGDRVAPASTGGTARGSIAETKKPAQLKERKSAAPAKGTAAGREEKK